jgi:hypothetical protein
MEKTAKEYAERFAKATEKLCNDLKFSKKDCDDAKKNAREYWLKMYKKKRTK